MHAQIRAELYKSPKRYVSDGRFTPEGTVQFMHAVSVEGASASFYCDTDLTSGLNGERDKLDQGVGVPVIATVDLTVNKAGKLMAYDLVKLAPLPGKSS